MTQKEFLELVKKYEQGKCSEREKEILFDYCNKVQAKAGVGNSDFIEEEKTRIKTLERINATLDQQAPNIKKGKVNYLRWSAVAAAILAIVVSVSVYVYTTQFIIEAIPENAITLELQDGNILHIQENANRNILDQDGKVIAHQVGNRILYNNTSSTEDFSHNVLKIPYGKTFELVLNDGTTIHLNAGSTINFPVSFDGHNERKVSFTGEAFLKVAKDEKKPFIVKVDKFNVRVFGTQFNIHSYPEDALDEVVLVEGSVGVYTENAGREKSMRLAPGDKASFHKPDGAFTKQQVRTSAYTSWVEGELVVRNMTLENILKKLERNYNVEIIHNNQKLPNELFNANFGKKPALEEVLNELKIAFGITYQIQKDSVIIH
ncbi:FecR domain-containing protein [Rapidithrix thailandica]|uniref:FecR domain-containing protein n=1 Tax=Rapidithrix thailandica TaxID=413964 RepID=A0AAW9S608_9BACT